MGNPVAMVEITSPDPARARAFYAGLFGWTVKADPAWGGYGLADTEPVPGGIAPGETPGATFYVGVDDLRVALDKAEALGGTRLIEPTDLPEGFGSFAMFADPDGTTIGLWKTA